MVSGDEEPLLTPQEVASRFRVDPKTVTRWAKAGRLTSIRTPGGHRRYRESEVMALLNGTAECPKCHNQVGSDSHARSCLDTRRSPGSHAA